MAGRIADSVNGGGGSGDEPTTIRDSLYDQIALGRRELALLRTPEFLRLDGIKQLGFVSRVWPGAKHSRFEHSLGVFALARRALASLRYTEGCPIPSAGDRATLEAAALLHDIGHYPFSHAIEELGSPVVHHEAVGRDIVESGTVAGVLEREWRVDPRRVADLIDRGNALSPAGALLSGLLSGTLDMDKLDYLPRDAKACNVPYGRVDTARLLGALLVAEVQGAPRIVVGEKGVSPLHSLINARQEMFDNVYWHHTNRACMSMLLRAVQDALIAGAVSAPELTRHDDSSLLVLLSRERMPSATKQLVEMLRLRQVYRRAVEISDRAEPLFQILAELHAAPLRRRRLEVELAATVARVSGHDVECHELLIDIPKPERWKTDAWVLFQRPPLGMRPLMHWHEVVGMNDDDFKRYEEHRRLIRIVCPERLRATVRAHFESDLVPLILRARGDTAGGDRHA